MRIALLFLMVLLVGCGRGEVESQAPQQQRAFAARDFNSVDLAGADDVRIVYGKNFAVSASGPAKALKRLDIRVEGGVLKLGRLKEENGWNLGWARDEKSATIAVTMPVIRSAVLSGAGDLDIKTATAPDSFSARLSGSGNLTVDNVQARAVDLITTGAGDILARGTAEAMAARLSGAGSLDARGLQVKDADIRLSGAGDVHANVSGTARGVLTGVGSIDVEGPAKCAIARTGVGDVRCGGDTDTGAGE
jgi:hypothetical protein